MPNHHWAMASSIEFLALLAPMFASPFLSRTTVGN